MSPRLEREAAVDDMAEWAVTHQQARFTPIGSAIPDPRPAPRYVPSHIAARSFTARSAISDKDVSEALEWMFTHGELSEELSERIDEKAMDFCKARLEAQGRDA